MFENKAKLFAKMAKVMSELTTFAKDATNKFHNYEYASAAQVTQVIGRAMGNAGIAFFPSIKSIERTDDNRYIVYYEYTFACDESGATFTTQWSSEASHTSKNGVIDDKTLNKIATTSLKYFLLTTFVVSASGDVDVDATQNQQKPDTWLGDNSQVDSVKRELDMLSNLYGADLVKSIKDKSNPKEHLNALDYIRSLEQMVEVAFENQKPDNSKIVDGGFNTEDRIVDGAEAQVNAAAQETMRQASGEPPPSASDKTEDEFKKALWSAVDFMYDNEHHKKNSLCALMSEDEEKHQVTPDMPLAKAVLEVMKHRAFVDFMIDDNKYFDVFGMAVETHYENNGAQKTWQKFQDYYAARQQPATPKAS